MQPFWNGNYTAEDGLRWKAFPFLCVNDAMTCLLSVDVLDLRIVTAGLNFPLNPMFFTEKCTCGFLPLLSWDILECPVCDRRLIKWANLSQVDVHSSLKLPLQGVWAYLKLFLIGHYFQNLSAITLTKIVRQRIVLIVYILYRSLFSEPHKCWCLYF
jgi:hypothetical protein